jgi:hypothetical protein
MNNMILCIVAPSDPKVLAYYGHSRQFRSITIKKQHASGKQLKIHTFSQPTRSQ